MFPSRLNDDIFARTKALNPDIRFASLFHSVRIQPVKMNVEKLIIRANLIRCVICAAVRGFATEAGRLRTTGIPFQELPTTPPTLFVNVPSTDLCKTAITFNLLSFYLSFPNSDFGTRKYSNIYSYITHNSSNIFP